MKENVKIFATPEAHELLLKLDGGLEIQKAVRAAVQLAFSAEQTGDHFITDSPLAIAAFWADHSNDTSYILLYKHDGFPHFYGCCESLFFEKIKTGIQVSLI